MNQDHDAYRLKWPNKSKKFKEHSKHFVSKQKNHFKVVSNWLHINQLVILRLPAKKICQTLSISFSPSLSLQVAKHI